MNFVVFRHETERGWGYKRLVVGNDGSLFFLLFWRHDENLFTNFLLAPSNRGFVGPLIPDGISRHPEGAAPGLSYACGGLATAEATFSSYAREIICCF